MRLKLGAGVVFLAEESLASQWLDELATWVAQQPPWSDLPFVVLTSCEQQPAVAIWRQQLITRLRNVVLLEGPVPPATLASTALSAVKARRCQYDVRAHFAERRQAALALKTLVAFRISELEAANTALRFEVAERERIEVSLHQAQKIKAIGQLTSDSAHDFNDMLQAINANLEMIRPRIEEGYPDEAVCFVEIADATVQRAAELICRSLGFVRQKALVPQTVGVDELIMGLDE